MIRIFFLVLLSNLSIIAQAATGDTLYVAERLYLSMSAEPLADSPRVRLLESGDRFEEVSRQGDFIQVRVADGTTGWVREAYVTATAPGSIRAATLQAEVIQLNARISQLETTPTTNEPVVPENPQLAAANQQLRDRIAMLESELEQAQQPALVQEEIPVKDSDPMTMRWAIAAAVGLLLLGGTLGFSWRSRQVRQRLHGLEI